MRFFDGDGRTIEVSSDVATRQHRAIEEGEAIPVRITTGGGGYLAELWAVAARASRRLCRSATR